MTMSLCRLGWDVAGYALGVGGCTWHVPQVRIAAGPISLSHLLLYAARTCAGLAGRFVATGTWRTSTDTAPGPELE